MMTDVIVVGAGPTGLTTAIELATRGLTVQVLDAATGPFRGSRGKGVQPRTMELLDRHGLAARMMSLGRFRLPICRWTEGPDGEPVGTGTDMYQERQPTPDSPYARGMIIPQWRTELVLREHLESLGVTPRWNTRVTGLTRDDDGVTVELEGAPAERASWVVGCDGGSSAVRHALRVTFLGETHDDIRMLLGDVVLEGVDRDRWHMWDPFLGLCPLPATDTFAFQAAGVDVDGPLDAAAFQGVLEDAGIHHVRIREVRWASRWRLNVRMVDRYRVGRVLLAGDAAHVHSPAGGQGLNTGVGDAVNLGWKLAAVHRGAPEWLLDTYEAERMPVAADVLGLSSSLLRNRRIEERSAEEGARGLQLGLGYRGGMLAAGPDGRPGSGASPDPATPDPAAGDGPRPGDRAPDAPLRDADGRRIRLFDVFRHPGWTLIGFGTDPEPVDGVRTVSVRPSPADAPALHDRAGFAASAYAPEPGELVLVRPDGYLALRTTDPAAVRTYLDAIGAVPAVGAVAG